MSAAFRILPVAVLAAVLTAGCLGSGGGANPNLLAPKLIVDADPSGDPLVFVHSAFGDRRYDRIEVRLDNETLAVRENAYSFERTVDARAFFMQVHVESGDARFTFGGTFTLDQERSRARIVVLDADGDWGDAQDRDLPYERILSREEGASS